MFPLPPFCLQVSRLGYPKPLSATCFALLAMPLKISKLFPLFIVTIINTLVLVLAIVILVTFNMVTGFGLLLGVRFHFYFGQRRSLFSFFRSSHSSFHRPYSLYALMVACLNITSYHRANIISKDLLKYSTSSVRKWYVDSHSKITKSYEFPLVSIGQRNTLFEVE